MAPLNNSMLSSLDACMTKKPSPGWGKVASRGETDEGD